MNYVGYIIWGPQTKYRYSFTDKVQSKQHPVVVIEFSGVTLTFFMSSQKQNILELT